MCEQTYTSIFSNNSKMIAAASADKTIRIWNVETGTVLRTIMGHTSWAFHCAFSPDDKKVMSTADDRTVRVWCVDTGEPCGTDTFVHKFGMHGLAEPEPQAPPAPAAAAPAKAAADPQKDTLERLLQEMYDTNTAFDAHMRVLSESRAAAMRKVDATMDTLLSAVAARRRELHEEVDAAYDEAAESLRRHRDAHNNAIVARIKEQQQRRRHEPHEEEARELPAMPVQRLQVCYYGNTSTLALAGEIQGVGHVTLSTAAAKTAAETAARPPQAPKSQGNEEK